MICPPGMNSIALLRRRNLVSLTLPLMPSERRPPGPSNPRPARPAVVSPYDTNCQLADFRSAPAGEFFVRR